MKKISPVIITIFNNIFGTYKSMFIPINIHYIMTFIFDRRLFLPNAIKENILVYLCMKVILYFTIIIIWHIFYSFFKRDDNILKQTVQYALPYFIFLLCFYFDHIKLHLEGDELGMYHAAQNMDIYMGHFGYPLGVVFIISYMLLPTEMGVVLIKLLIQSLIAGYCITKVNRAYGNNNGFFMYIVFCLYPMVDRSVSVHRMYWYSLLYFVFFIILFLDYKEKKELSVQKLLFFLFSIGILTVWRFEAIYLLIIAPVLLTNVYRLKDKKKVFISVLVVIIIAYVPTFLHINKQESSIEPSYAAIITHMLDENIDRNKYKEEIDTIDKVYIIDQIDYINRIKKFGSYGTAFIRYEEYNGLRNYSQEDLLACQQAIRKIVMNEPLKFIKTRIKQWFFNDYFYWKHLESANKILRLYKIVAMDLNIPLIAMIISIIYGFIKKNWLMVIFGLGIVCHVSLTLAATPAGYFEYYMYMYMIGYFYIVLAFGLLAKKIMSRKKEIIH